MAESKSNNAMVMASASRKGPMKHKFRMIEIHPASNGFTVKHHPPMPEAKKGEEGMRYIPPPEPTESVFSGGDAAQQVQAHIGSLMGAGKAPGNKDQKSGSEKDKKPASGKEDAADKKGEGENEADDEDD